MNHIWVTEALNRPQKHPNMVSFFNHIASILSECGLTCGAVYPLLIFNFVIWLVLIFYCKTKQLVEQFINVSFVSIAPIQSDRGHNLKYRWRGLVQLTICQYWVLSIKCQYIEIIFTHSVHLYLAVCKCTYDNPNS